MIAPVPLSSIALLRPRSLLQALSLLRADPSLVPAAGCTDIYVALRSGALRARRFLDIAGLRELRRIRLRRPAARGTHLSIGALATYRDLLASPLLARRLPMLAAAAGRVGSPQIRICGTIGGNVGTASPAGDTLPVLAAADAVVVLRSVDGTRRVPICGFYPAYRRTLRRADELIVALEVPPVAGRQWFRKVGARAGPSISQVVMAAVRAPRVRIALGSVAPTVVRARRTEEWLAGGGSIEDACRVLMDEIRPIDDHRSTAEYRRTVAAGWLRRFWKETA